MSDVIIIGGGVIGLSIAYELAGQGVAVTLLEKEEIGKEASWAGAGMLPPGNPEKSTTPMMRLQAESHLLWETLTKELYESTGIDNGYRLSGCLEVSLGDDTYWNEQLAKWRREGVVVKELTTDELHDIEPTLSPEIHKGFHLPEQGQARNPRHLHALKIGCAKRDVRLVSGTPVVGFEMEGDAISAVVTENKTFTANKYCICNGAWATSLLTSSGAGGQVKPIRGQIVQLQAQPLPFTHIVEVGARYLVPRPDGRILIGSTEEDVGFQKQNTSGGVTGLLKFATELVPELSSAQFITAWSGFRPKTEDGLPYLGTVPQVDNLYVAAGHYRNGLQMSPGTAKLMRQVILEQDLFMDITSFATNRHSDRVQTS